MTDLDSLRVYRRAMRLGDAIWREVSGWSFFEQDTIGKQFARSMDSVAANISEGNGRYHFGENRQFCYYARGSLEEAKTWLRKAQHRQLIDAARAAQLRKEMNVLSRMLNAYIRSIGAASRKRSEP